MHVIPDTPTLHPGEFQVDEAWIVFRLNEAPIVTEADGAFNVIAMMDAASCFILGAEFVPVSSAELSKIEAKRLIKSGKSHHHRLPGKLYIPENMPTDSLSEEAKRNGIEVVRVPEKHLLAFIGEAREGFKEQIGEGSLH